MLGHHYSSQAVVPEVNRLELASEVDMESDKESVAEPTESPFLESLDHLGRPGTRASHVWLFQQGKRLSTLDLFGRHFVLLCGEDGQPWQRAAHSVATTFGLKLLSYRVGPTG